MKRLLAVLFLLSGAAPVFAGPGPTGASEIALGRVALSAHDLPTAQTHFAAAVAINDASKPTAAALLGITNLFTVMSQGGSTTFLNGLAVQANGRDVHHWTAQLPKDINGNSVLPTNYNLTTVATYWQNTLVPTLATARANFASVTNPAFLLTLYPSETTMPAAINLDYGDILMAQASLSALEFCFHFLSGQNLDANLDAMNQLAQGDLLTLQQVLLNNPNALKLGSTSERVAAQTSLLTFIQLYNAASTFIRTVRPAGVNRLFMLDPSDLAREADFRALLDRMKLSATESVATNKRDVALYSAPLFGSTWTMRNELPVFNATTGGFDLESIADPSLGGIASGLTRERIAHSFDHAELGFAWVSPSPQGNSLYRHLALSNGNRIVSGDAGTIFTSGNGAAWAPHFIPRAGRIAGLAEGTGSLLGKVVGVGLGEIYFSTDSGATWQKEFDGTTQLRAVTYGGGQFVAVGDGGSTLVSTDGKNWQFGFVGSGSVTLDDVLYSGSLYVAVGVDTSVNKGVIYTSPDGLNWTLRLTAASSGYTFFAVAQGASHFVAVGSNNHSAVSSNATAWTESTVLASGSTQFNGVAYRSSDALFIAGGNAGTAATIADATLTTTPTANWTSVVTGETVANFDNVSLAPDGVYFASGLGIILRSQNLVAGSGTFTRILNPTPAGAVSNAVNFSGLRAIGGTLYVVGGQASGAAGTILTSTDGVTFTPVTTTGTTNQLYGLIQQGGTYYAVGDAGTIVTSANGQTWAPIVSGITGSNSTSNLRFIDFQNGQFVAAGTGGVVLTSPAGATNTWTNHALAGAAPGTIYGVAYGNGTYVAVGGNDGSGTSGNNYVYTSMDNGTTWIQCTLGTFSTFRAVVFNLGVFTAVGFDGAIYQSADGIAWTYVPNDVTTHFVGLRVLDGRYYALARSFGSFTSAPQCAVVVSSDGRRWTSVFEGTSNLQLGVELYGGRVYTSGSGTSLLRSESLAASAVTLPVALAPVPGTAVTQGTDHTLAVTTNVSGSQTFVWKKGGTTIPNVTGPVLQLKNVQSTDAASYTVTMTNAVGTPSSAATFAFTVSATGAAPTITQQPVSQTVNVGLNATFTGAANGTTPLTYQWKKDTGTGPVSLTDGPVSGAATVAGSTTATLTLTGVQAADAASYTLVVSGTGSPATSLPAVLTVDSNPAYTFSTLAGLAFTSGNLNSTGSAARFNSPSGVTVDTTNGDIYVADTANGAIRKVTSAGVVTTVASGSFGNPIGIVLVGSNLYFTTSGHVVRTITTSGTGLAVLAGTVGSTGSADGAGLTTARFNTPKGISADPFTPGFLYVADSGNHTIRKVVIATGVVSTVAGSAGNSGLVNATGTAAKFNNPQGVAVDNGSSNLYVADSSNNVIRKIVLSTGAVTTFAGQAGIVGEFDAMPATSAAFAFPVGISVDGLGYILVGDNGGHTLRKIAADGSYVRTLGGQPFVSGGNDGVGAAALFYAPSAPAQYSGNLFIVDANTNTLREGAISTPIPPVTILVAPQSQTANIGGNVTLSVTATAAGGPSLSYQWKKNGVALSNGGSISGATSPTLFLAGLQTSDAGSYTVVVSAGGNFIPTSVSPVATLAINPGPQITVQPSDQAFAVGGTIKLGVTALGSPTLAYQWYKDGAALVDGGSISGSTTAQLLVTNAQTTDSGGYQVQVANSFGGAISNAAGVLVYDYEPYTFFTLAGRAPLGTDDAPSGPGSLARFNSPNGIARDSAGNLFVADFANHAIRRVAVGTGAVTTFAGLPGTAGYADGTGGAARFNGPTGIAIDPASGNVYVCEFNNSTVRKITPAGVVTTLAGLAGAPGGVDGTGGGAQFSSPRGLAIDATGTNLYVADTANHTIRKIVISTGAVTTLAGVAGSSGSADGSIVGGVSTARLFAPDALAVDAAGNVYVADEGNCTIRQVTAAGVVTTLVGQAGASGNVDGAGSTARFALVFGLARDAVSGNLYVTDNSSIRKIVVSGGVGTVTTIAGTAGSTGNLDQTGTAARFASPEGLVVDAAGANVYVADNKNHTIRTLVVSTNAVTTLAGSPSTAGTTNAVGTAARFNLPQSVAPDLLGNVYVADTNNHTIRRIAPDGTVSLFSGTAGTFGSTDGAVANATFRNPSGVVTDFAGDVYIADKNNDTIRVYTPSTGNVTTLAGLAGVASFADGTGGVAGTARFNGPSGLTVDPAGNVYVADQRNHVVRKISAAGIVTTLAGFPGVSGYVDGTGSAARFNSPQDVAVDSAGNVYVADAANKRVRKITPAGVVTTVTVVPNQPFGIGVDAADNVYTTGQDVVLKITPAGVVTAIGGVAFQAGSADGPGSVARFNGGWGVKVDRSGNVLVADGSSNTIRKGYNPVVPVIGVQPVNQTVTAGGNASLTVGAIGSGPLNFLWQINGVDLFSATSASPTLAIVNAQPGDAGIYRAVVSGASASVVSAPAIVGVGTTSKVIGSGTEFASNIFVPASGNTYDYVLLTGTAATVTADPGQVTTVYFIDPSDDIVAVEFSGAGALTVSLDGATGPAAPINYNSVGLFAGLNFMKGNAGIVVSGANQTTNVAVYSLGTVTATNQAILKNNVTYDGMADIAFVAISSANGQFGGLRTSNARYSATQGLTGVFAPGVAFTGPIFVGDITASGAATPTLVVGSQVDTRITGGRLLQTNSQPVLVSGFTAALPLKFVAGSTSAGVTLPAQTNQGVLLPYLASPSVTVPPAAFASGTVGGSVSLSVQATGGAFTYQWYKFGQPLVGQTGATLTLTPLALFDAGLYSVRVSNSGVPFFIGASSVTVTPAQPLPAALTAAAAFAPLVESEINSTVSTLQLGSDGNVYLTGSFTSFAGAPRPGFARLNATGVLDTGFVPVSLNGAIQAVAVQPDGKVIVVGSFGQAGGFARDNVVRLNANGTVDLSFAPAFSFGGTVYAVALQTNGKIVVGGDFDDGQNIVRLNSDGSVDSTFNVGSGFDDVVRALVVQPDGKIVVGGDFLSYNGSSIGRIARVDTLGVLDAGFAVGAVGFDGTVTTLALQTDGNVVASGNFTHYQGTGRNAVARLLGISAAPDPAFDSGNTFNLSNATLQLQSDGNFLVTGHDGKSGLHQVTRVLSTGLVDMGFANTAASFSSDVNAAVRLTGGQILVALASDSSTYSAVAIGKIVRLSSAAVLDTTYAPTVRRAGSVAAVVPAPNGQWIVAGTFDHVNGLARNNLARLNANGSTDTAFMNTGTGFDDSVYAVAVQPDGKVIAGGAFWDFNGSPVNYLARLDNTGTLDPSFAVGTGFDNSVFALALQADGQLLVGGAFATYQNSLCPPGLARLAPNGALDSNFDRGGSGAGGGSVFTLLALPSGGLYAGGDFSAYDDASAGGLVRLTNAGTMDSSFAVSSGFNDQVAALALQPNGQLVVGGYFNLYQDMPVGNVTRLNSDGTPDSGFAITEFQPGGSSSGVQSLLLQGDGKIVAGGSFTDYGSATPLGLPSLARLNANGTIDATFRAPGLTGPVSAMQFAGAGTLLLGGGELDFPNRAAAGVAMLETVPDVSLTATPLGATVSVGGAVSLALTNTITPTPTTFQWLKDGVAIAGATSASYAIPHAANSDSGSYVLVVTVADGVFAGPATAVLVVERALLAQASKIAVPIGGSVTASFTVEGSNSKAILIRGAGPALTTLGVSNVLADPRLDLVDSTGAIVATNDNWGSSPSAIATAAASVGAFPFANGSKDAAILAPSLAPGTYTVVLSGVGGLGGTANLEIYDADNNLAPRIVMLATHARVGTNSFPVAGFTVTGTGSKQILIRVLGQSLGLSDGVIEDPMVAVFNSSNVELAFNDDCRNPTSHDFSRSVTTATPPATNAAIDAAVATVGAQPVGDTLDAAVLLTLAPGSYTAQVTPFNPGDIGDVLIEIFDADNPRPPTFAPAITYLAGNQAAMLGRSVTFGVNVLGKPAPTYQWTRHANGVSTPIIGATGPVLSLFNLQSSDFTVAGVPVTYDVTVTNSAGSLTGLSHSITLLPSIHSADYNGGPDGKIDLVELTRVIQLYNYRAGPIRTGEYHTQAGTEDGFAPGPGPIQFFHSADSNHDGQIDGAELQRVIQLYNYVNGTVRTGEYQVSPGTVDGFDLGPFAP